MPNQTQSPASILGTNVITQIGILVHDIEKTAQAYADFFGVQKPPCNWTDRADIAQTEYRGKPSAARSMLAFLTWGPCSWN